MNDHKNRLMTMDLRCWCSHSSKMKAFKYCARTWITPETVIYECTRCGKRKIVHYTAEAMMAAPESVVEQVKPGLPAATASPTSR